MGIELTDDQLRAIKKASEWYKKKESQVFIISGYAGTGKSTVVGALVDELGLKHNTRYATYTGKASLVLNEKGNPAETLHSLIYVVEEDLSYAGYTKLVFRKRFYLHESIKLIVVDEISMVSKKIMNDLLSFGIPVIGLGDPEQLPPIGEDNGYLENPDVFLTEIHRQSEGNPIIHLSMLARRGERIDHGKYGEKVQVITADDLNYELMSKADQIICGYNKTRQGINAMFRQKKGYTSLLPHIGDKVICTRNNWAEIADGYPLINGTIGYVTGVGQKDLDDNRIKMSFKADFMKEGFENLDCDIQEFLCIPKWQIKRNEYNKFDYGYAITCHKAQGSEFKNVLLINEVLNPELHSRWLYTGITRAMEGLILVI